MLWMHPDGVAVAVPAVKNRVLHLKIETLPVDHTHFGSHGAREQHKPVLGEGVIGGHGIQNPGHVQNGGKRIFLVKLLRNLLLLQAC